MRRARTAEIAIRIFQMFVAKQHFSPFAAVGSEIGARVTKIAGEFAVPSLSCLSFEARLATSTCSKPFCARFPLARTSACLPKIASAALRFIRRRFCLPGSSVAAPSSQPAKPLTEATVRIRRAHRYHHCQFRALQAWERQSNFNHASRVRAHKTSITCGTSDPAQSN